MPAEALIRDPFSIIITGVGGQGNVLASRLLGSMLAEKGFFVTIGETFGASQRGGSVMSHVRVSRESVSSPQIPRGRADIIVSLEPVEALRVLADYGNPEVVLLTNTRPIYPVGVIRGELEYPPLDILKDAIRRILPEARFIDGTEKALELGNPILTNIVMLGALYGLNVVPFDRRDFERAIVERVAAEHVAVNLSAFDEGCRMIRS